MFYKVSARAARESTAALHPRSRAPRTPARRYGPDVVNELAHIRKQLKADGWDYGPRSIHYAAAMEERFPGERVPSVATIGRLLSAVGQVDPAPKKRPKSSHIPFVRATAMALWQLDAFEYRLADGRTGGRADGQTGTVYQVLDDATRYDVGSWAHTPGENSADTQQVLRRAIDEHGAPQSCCRTTRQRSTDCARGRLARSRCSSPRAAPCPSPGCQAGRPLRVRTSDCLGRLSESAVLMIG